MKDAAEELCVTHGAISRQIQLLETALGMLLFEGPKNKPRLTEAGKILMPTLTKAFNEIGDTIEIINHRADGNLVVSGIGFFTMRWIIPRLHRFQTEHPHIEIKLSSSDDPVDFGRESFDVAVRVGPPRWPDDAMVVKLFSEKFGPVAAPDLAWASMPVSTETMRLNARTRPDVWEHWSLVSGLNIPARGEMMYDQFCYTLEAAIGGLGVCISPWSHAADHLKSEKLMAPLGFVDSGYEYVALRPNRRNRRAELFCEWLEIEARSFAADEPRICLRYPC